MKVYDCLYGEFDELESVLVELIHSNPIQRLKKIHQAGGCFLINEKWNVTRYDHSIGVMLLIRKVGGSLEEQIAGLLHDVSHTAFSHVVDYVLDNHEENYHEQIVKELIFSSEIPYIVKKYGLNIDELLNTKNWPLLEQDLPNLCADRIDYTLRDMYHYENIPLSEVHEFLNHISVHHQQLVITSKVWAEWFIHQFYREVMGFFLHPKNVYANQHLAFILKLALERKIIHMDDFLLDDEAVMNKLNRCNDREIHLLLSYFSDRNGQYVTCDQEFEYKAKVKPRIIDPFVLDSGKVVRASAISTRAQVEIEYAYERCKQETYVRRVKSTSRTGINME